MAETAAERLARVETKLEEIERAIARIERAVGKTLADHEKRICGTEDGVDQVRWLSGAILAAIPVAAGIVVIAKNLGLI